MKKIILLDPSIGTLNEGDRIITMFVNLYIKELFPNDFISYLPTQMGIYSKFAIKNLLKSDYTFVGGSNLLSSNMNRVNQWKINYIHIPFYKNTILFGTGWWQYQRGVNLYTSTLLKNILSKKFLHSVRDEYTRVNLNEAGIQYVINTGCPTTWGLTRTFCDSIISRKQQDVVFTLTDYLKDYEYDRNMIRILKKNYRNLYFWPQGYGDTKYLSEIADVGSIQQIKPGVDSYIELLRRNGSIDYVGTRLHGGILAINHKKRCIVIGIDNRAKEMKKSINLKVVERLFLDELEDSINSNFKTEISINEENILKWKNQFK